MPERPAQQLRPLVIEYHRAPVHQNGGVVAVVVVTRQIRIGIVLEHHGDRVALDRVSDELGPRVIQDDAAGRVEQGVADDRATAEGLLDMKSGAGAAAGNAVSRHMHHRVGGVTVVDDAVSALDRDLVVGDRDRVGVRGAVLDPDPVVGMAHNVAVKRDRRVLAIDRTSVVIADVLDRVVVEHGRPVQNPNDRRRPAVASTVANQAML